MSTSPTHTIKLSITLPESLHRAAKEIADVEGTSVAEVIATALRELQVSKDHDPGYAARMDALYTRRAAEAEALRSRLAALRPTAAAAASPQTPAGSSAEAAGPKVESAEAEDFVVVDSYGMTGKPTRDRAGSSRT